MVSFRWGSLFPDSGWDGMLSRGCRQMHTLRTFSETLTSRQWRWVFPPWTVLSAAEKQLGSMEWHSFWRKIFHKYKPDCGSGTFLDSGLLKSCADATSKVNVCHFLVHLDLQLVRREPWRGRQTLASNRRIRRWLLKRRIMKGTGFFAILSCF